MDPQEVLRVLRRRAWLILSAAFLAVVVAGVLVHRSPPVFRATGTVRLGDARQALTGGTEEAIVERFRGANVDPVLSQVQVLRSRSLLGTVVDQVGLQLQWLPRGPSFVHLDVVEVDPGVQNDTLRVRFFPEGVVFRGDFGEVRVPYGEPMELPGALFTIHEAPSDIQDATLLLFTRDQAVDHLLHDLRVRPRDRTDVLAIDYTAPDPALAQRVVNAVVQAFQLHDAALAQEGARRRKLFIEEQLDEANSRLRVAQDALSRFRSRELAFSSREKMVAQQAGIMGLEMRWEELEAERQIYQGLLVGLEDPRLPNRGGSLRALVSTPGIGANPVVVQLYGQLVQYEAARDSMVTGAWATAADHPDVLRLTTLVRGTEDRIVEAVRSHVTSVEARIAALQDLRERNAATLGSLPEREAEEVRLIQQVETARRLVDHLQTEHQNAQLAEAVGVGQVEILDPAPLPSEPIPRRATLALALALMVGLMGGGLLSLALELLDTSIRRSRDLPRDLPISELGVIPRVGVREARWVVRGNDRGAPRLAEDADAWGDRSSSHTLARTESAEAYQALRTHLMFSAAWQDRCVLMVTSPSPREGKSTTAANLAVSFALQGRRVLLVDADLRRPSLHRFFHVPPDPGLSDLLGTRSGTGDVVHRTMVRGLELVPSGTVAANASELLGSGAMDRFLGQARARYDIIILDTPPVLAAADGLVLASMADGALVVVRLGTTRRGAAQSALRRLAAVDVPMVGVVLNDPNGCAPQDEGGYYSYAQYATNGKSTATV